jgi:hypothetical protein
MGPRQDDGLLTCLKVEVIGPLVSPSTDSAIRDLHVEVWFEMNFMLEHIFYMYIRMYHTVLVVVDANLFGAQGFLFVPLFSSVMKHIAGCELKLIFSQQPPYKNRECEIG